MEQQEYEREIDLKNLLYYVLCRWKLILLAALLCMAVMGGYKYVSVSRGQAVEREGATQEDEGADIGQTVQDALDGLVDPNTLKGDVLLYYNLLLKNKGLDDEIAKNQSLLEGSKSQLENLEKQQAEYRQNASHAEDGDISQDIRESTLAYLISDCEKNRASAEYTIKTLQAKKAKNEDNAALLLESLEQKEEEEEEEEEAAVTVEGALRNAVKFAVVGLVGGAFAVAFILCLMYLFSGKLLDAGILRDAYGLRVLSVIPEKRARKGIDGLIDKLDGHVFRTKEEAYDVIYGRMSNLAGELKGKTVLVTGMADESHVQELAEYLQAKDGSVKYIIFANPLKNLDMLSMFRQADEILLVEQIGRSGLEEIRQEMYFMDDVKKKPLGAAVVG